MPWIVDNISTESGRLWPVQKQLSRNDNLCVRKEEGREHHLHSHKVVVLCDCLKVAHIPTMTPGHPHPTPPGSVSNISKLICSPWETELCRCNLRRNWVDVA